jgi:hypothetical protein
MKNNKGYYSWIHSLNRAGIESQHRGFNLLNEAKRGRPSQFPEDLSDLQYDPNARAKIDARIRASGENRSNEARSATQISNISRVDLKPIGDDTAEQVQHNTIPSMVDTSYVDEVEDHAVQSRLAAEILKDAIANRQRRWDEEDAGKKLIKPEDYAAEFEDEMRGAGHGSISLGSGRHPYEPTDEHLPESISQKINRMLNEEPNSGKGHITKSYDTEFSRTSPNLEGAPKGMFSGTETPEQKLGKILEIVRGGAKKHGASHHAWASAALETIQKGLRKS